MTAGVLDGDEFLSTTDLLDRSARAATGFASLGVGAGDSIALILPNGHPFFEASFAAAMLGAGPVPVNWHGKPDELRYVIDDCAARVVVVDRSFLGGLGDVGVPVLVVDGDDPASNWSVWRSSFEPLPDAKLRTPTSMIYTSGTTGKPKGVRRQPGTGDSARRHLAIEGAKVMGITKGMRTVICGPMYHTAPNVYGLSAARLDGFVVVHPRFDPEALLAAIETHRITHLHLVPTMFVRLLKLPVEIRTGYDVSCLELVVHAAAPCPPDVKRAMIDWLGPIVHEYYGATEVGSVVACDSAEWLAHPGTVGKALPGAIVRIYADDGSVLPAGEIGEVFMRGGGMPDFTYQNRPDARAEVERDGLVTCGDVGYLDDDGYLFLCDRKRDMVISGGVNIYPAEIEACLLSMPGVRDCAVFGVPDDEFGEALAAAVEVEDAPVVTSDDVRRWVGASLAAYKVPRLVEFHDALPREDSGKIFKRRLRDPHWEGAGRSI